jgi:hypothetical protein
MTFKKYNTIDNAYAVLDQNITETTDSINIKDITNANSQTNN